MNRTNLLIIAFLFTFSATHAGSQSFIGVDFRPPPRLDIQHVDKFSVLGVDSCGFDFLIWNVVEPNEPENGVHSYIWSYPDEMIRTIGDAGGRAMITIRIASNWANREGFEYGDYGYRPAIPPRVANLEDFGKFVNKVVERYDGDGQEDMPGLNRPHLIYQFEGETELHWKGTPEEYANLLAIFYDSVKQASPDALVVAMGFNLSDIFDHNPTVEELNALTLPDGQQKRKEFVEFVLLNSEHFDIIGTNCNYHYTGFPARMRWIRSMNPKPVWCSDLAVGYLYNRHQFQEPIYPPMTEYFVEQTLRYGSTGFQEVIERASAEQAKFLLKKLVVAATTGYERQYMQWAIEAPNPLHGWVHTGLLEDNIPERGMDGGTPRPAYYTLKLFLEKIGEFESVENLNPLPGGTDPFNWTWLIKFTGITGDVYVAWTDNDGRIIDLSPHVPSSYVRLTHIVTELNGNNFPIQPPDLIVPTNAIHVGQRPVFIEQD